jgi:hypothetical protein
MVVTNKGNPAPEFFPMPSSSILSVSFLNANSGNWELSRYFQTVRAARRWARWLSTQSHVTEVAVHRGGAGGERLAA